MEVEILNSTRSLLWNQTRFDFLFGHRTMDQFISKKIRTAIKLHIGWKLPLVQNKLLDFSHVPTFCERWTLRLLIPSSRQFLARVWASLFGCRLLLILNQPFNHRFWSLKVASTGSRRYVFFSDDLGRFGDSNTARSQRLVPVVAWIDFDLLLTYTRCSPLFWCRIANELGLFCFLVGGDWRLLCGLSLKVRHCHIV